MMAIAATVGMMVSMASPAWAATWNIADGDIKITAKEDGQYVYQDGKTGENGHRETDETIITGTSTENTVTIEAKKDQTADVTLDDLNIDVSSKSEAAITIKGEGDVNLELDGKNEVKSGISHAGIEKNDSDSTGTLTIKDEKNDDGTVKTGEDTDTTGTLEATGGFSGAGIGGGDRQSTSQIVIDGGTIEAEGGEYAAGIGGGGSGDGEVTINAGTVTAIGGYCGAGIGGGSNRDGDVTINAGTVTAIGGYRGAGIGGGVGGDGDVTINNGEVTANGGTSGAGIGGGWKGAGTVTVDGGTVTATSGDIQFDAITPDAIGAGGYYPEGKKPQSKVAYNDGIIVEQPANWDANDHTHTWEVSETENGRVISRCECGSKKTEIFPGLTSDEQMPLEVTGLFANAQPYEQSVENGRIIFAAPAEDAVLSGSLGALAELKAQGAQTLVFRTWQCETSVSIDKLLAAGSEDDVFVLTHKGTQAVLTVAGRVVK